MGERIWGAKEYPFYEPDGVRYVCSSLYMDPVEPCPGRNASYGENAEEEALKNWNTRTPILSENDVYYLKSIERELKELAEIVDINDSALGQEVLYDNLDWLDCFIEKGMKNV